MLERIPAVTDQQPCWCVVVLDLAPFHDDDPLTETFDLGHVVRGEQHRCIALLAKLFKPAAHPVGRVGVKRGGRLIQQQHLRGVYQRLCERDPGLLSSRKLSDRPVEQLRQVQLLGERDNAVRKVRDGIEPSEHFQILAHAQTMRQVDIRALKIHFMKHTIAFARHRGSEHFYRARCRRHQSKNHGESGGLTCTIAAEKPGDRAWLKCKRNTVDRPCRIVDLHELINGDGGLGTHANPGLRNFTFGKPPAQRQGVADSALSRTRYDASACATAPSSPLPPAEVAM